MPDSVSTRHELRWGEAKSCTAAFKLMRPPVRPSAAASFRNLTRRFAAEPPPSRPRRVWELIPFGFELQMLSLHLRTLRGVVDAFFIAESNITHQGAFKHPMLSLALRRGDFPPLLAEKIHLEVVGLLANGSHPHCGPVPNGYSYKFVECLDEFQRYVPLRMVLPRLAPSDLVLMADFDEIAQPRAVDLLRRCFPFDPEGGEPGVLMLIAHMFTYGLHCVAPGGWHYGPKLASGGYLLRNFAPFSDAHTPRRAYNAIRQRTKFGSVSMDDAGWHFSSFGPVEALHRKYTSWSHARQFTGTTSAKIAKNGYENDTLSPERLDRCAKFCLEPTASMCQALAVPCDWKHFLSRRVPPCLSRSDEQSRKIPGRLLVATTQLRSPAFSLPPLLLNSPEEFKDYYRFLGVDRR